jgi:hypothetical protein
MKNNARGKTWHTQRGQEPHLSEIQPDPVHRNLVPDGTPGRIRTFDQKIKSGGFDSRFLHGFAALEGRLLLCAGRDFLGLARVGRNWFVWSHIMSCHTENRLQGISKVFEGAGSSRDRRRKSRAHHRPKIFWPVGLAAAKFAGARVEVPWWRFVMPSHAAVTTLREQGLPYRKLGHLVR